MADNSDASPISQILDRLGMSRDDLTRHTEQMRTFLENQAAASAATGSDSLLGPATPTRNHPQTILDLILRGQVTAGAGRAASTPVRRRDAPPFPHSRSYQPLATSGAGPAQTPLKSTASSPASLPTPSFLRDSPLPVTSPVTSSSPVRSPDNTDADRSPPYRLPPPPYPNYKPPFSYAALIGQAILAAPTHRLTLSDIYKYITTVYPYYQKGQIGWQNSIRHNLSLNPCFKKIDKVTGREVDRSTKGSLWAIGDEYVSAFEGGGFKKPQGVLYLNSKKRQSQNADGTKAPAKRPKTKHTRNDSLKAASIARLPSLTQTEECATSSCASSPPPSVLTVSSSSSLPDLTNGSSSSPPVEDAEEEGDNTQEIPEIPDLSEELGDVFLAEPLLHAAPIVPSRAPSRSESSFHVKTGPDLLSRVIESKSTPTFRVSHQSTPVDLPQPDERRPTASLFPQSHLRTPTQPSVSNKRRTMEDILEGKSRELPKWSLPVTPQSSERVGMKTPPPQNAVAHGAPPSPEKTPVRPKSVSDIHDRFFKKRDGSPCPDISLDVYSGWVGPSREQYPQVRGDDSKGKSRSISNERPHTPPPDADWGEQMPSTPVRPTTQTSNVRTPIASTSTSDFHPMHSPKKHYIPEHKHLNTGLFGHPKTPLRTTTRKPFTPSMFTTPLPHLHSLHPPLFDPYDTPAALADELNHLENPNEKGYGESPGSFFGQRRGLLYESPVPTIRRRDWREATRWGEEEQRF